MNDQNIPAFEGPVCPVPLKHDEAIVMGHGSGGKMTQDLVKKVFKKYFNNEFLAAGNDFAQTVLPENAASGRLSISTDAHIVSPLFFPGGDIGRLAVCGTVNDMSMSGALPLYLTASFILEEGLSVRTLEQIAASMQAAAEQADVKIVAGDTKVVERGKGDGVFISTTGIGWLPHGREIRGDLASPGDAVLISGTLGDHGIAVLSARGDLGFETDVQSDVAPLNNLINTLLEVSPGTRVLRDPTRGGLATTLNEIAEQSAVGIEIFEDRIPITPAVSAASEMLGFDPLYIANEGKLIVILPQDEKEAALEAMRSHPYGLSAAEIGVITEKHPKRVTLRTIIGTSRLLDIMSGEMLPRIC